MGIKIPPVAFLLDGIKLATSWREDPSLCRIALTGPRNNAVVVRAFMGIKITARALLLNGKVALENNLQWAGRTGGG